VPEEQNEFKTDIEKLHDSVNYKHCKNNPIASKPFAEMKKIKLTPLSEKTLEEVAKQYDVEPNCVMCLSIESFLKLPWNKQLEFLKGKN
jgi:hypothetical protein